MKKLIHVAFDVETVNVPVALMSEDKYEALKWAEMSANGDRSAADYQG